VPLRLVLVEDHQALREGLELLLGREGCDVVGTAGTAAEGQQLVEELAPDVALVDIRLGDDNGIDLTRRLLRADPERRIVLYTGSSDEEVLFDGLDSGARGYALKDGSPRELVDALALVAGGGSYVDPRLRPALLSRRATERLPALSNREREVLDLLAQGLTGEQAAEKLFLSAETIKTHVPQRHEQARGAHARPRDRHRVARGLHLAARGHGHRPMTDGLTPDQLSRLRHDLRTPLTVVIGFAEILAGPRPLSDEDRRDYAARVLSAAMEIREMIDTVKLD
jgi:DNA-binding NarL/FixJ family response regulator